MLLGVMDGMVNNHVASTRIPRNRIETTAKVLVDHRYGLASGCCLK